VRTPSTGDRLARRIPVLCLVIALEFGLAGCDRAGVARQASPLAPGGPAVPEPSPGPVVRVSSSDELRAAIGALASGATIELAAGDYPVLGDAFTLPQHISDASLVGATGRPEDVIVRGGRFGFWADNVTGLAIRHLTLVGMSEHGLILNCGVDRPTIRNVRFVDIGDQFIKANPGPGGCGVDEGVVEGSLFDYSTVAPDGYTNAIDVHFGTGWQVRGNTFRNFRHPGDLAGPAILFWNGSAETVVEQNHFENNARDIALGFDPGKTGAPPVNAPSVPDHRGGRVAGNTVTRTAGVAGRLDVAISVADSPDTRIDGNTVTMAGTYHNAIEYRFSRTTGVVIVGNTVDAAIAGRDGATATVTGNSPP